MSEKPYTRAALAADAVSLGPHWVYNQSKLARIYPEGVRGYTDPASHFHPNRKAGQFTHYGDQAAMLAEWVNAEGGFDLEGWRAHWVRAMRSYDGYLDGASKQTLKNDGAKPSDSDDLAGAARIGPLLDLDLPLEDTIRVAREQTALTHGAPVVADAAEFFVRAAFALRDGLDMPDALGRAATEGAYNELDARADLEKALEAEPENFLETSNIFGLTCHTREAFPLALYFALRPGAGFVDALSDNGLAGGDTSARAMLFALLFVARDGDVASALPDPGGTTKVEARPGSNPVGISTPRGRLAGVLEMPEGGSPVAFALFAHCFTCGKDFVPEKRITQGLARENIATLRIDFSGIGKSEGNFEDASFVTNLEDLELAAQWLEEHFEAPSLLLGHSLGGAAALGAAGRLSGVKAVATVGAPADPGHVTHLFADQVETIRARGAAEVRLAGRPFVVGKRFLDDLDVYCHREVLEGLRGIDFLILHAPKDQVVGIDNAGEIFTALHHPKSFISLAEADHLLTRKADADYVARVIAAWAGRALSAS